MKEIGCRIQAVDAVVSGIVRLAFLSAGSSWSADGESRAATLECARGTHAFFRISLSNCESSGRYRQISARRLPSRDVHSRFPCRSVLSTTRSG